MSFLKDRFHDLIKNQGLKAGFKPVANLAGENDRINEIKRLKLEDKDVSNDRQLNNVTELACYLTERPHVDQLTDKSQLSKNNHGFSILSKSWSRKFREISAFVNMFLNNPVINW